MFASRGGAISSEPAANAILHDAARDSTAVMAVRQLYHDEWNGRVGLSSDMLVARLRRDLTDGIMFAAFYIPSWDFTGFVTTKQVDISDLLADPPGTPQNWSPTQRIAAMLRRIPGCMAIELKDAAAALLKPKPIALFAVLAVGLVVSQGFIVGEFVDGILMAAAWAYMRWQGLLALKDFIAAIIDAAGETTLTGIQADAQTAADALGVLGMNFLNAILLRAADQEKVISLESDTPKDLPPVKKPRPVVKGWKDFPSSAGAVAGRGYASQNEAALAALKEANPSSIRDNLEYGGLIYKDNNTGTFGYSGPIQGTDQGVNPWSAGSPPNTTVVGDYHTHGDYSIIDPTNGNTVRTSDPLQDDFDSDNFSGPDYVGIQSDAASRPNYQGYLGTPSGTFKVYDPSTGGVGILGP